MCWCVCKVTEWTVKWTWTANSGYKKIHNASENMNSIK